MPRLWIRVLQSISIGFMWIFAVSVVAFVIWLILVAARWNDALNWTLAISIVMTPVYILVGAVLTYVYIGLQRGLTDPGATSADEVASTEAGNDAPGAGGKIAPR